MTITVSQDGSGDFLTITDALEASRICGITEPVILHIKPGIYRERPVFQIPGITVIGDAVTHRAGAVIIAGELSANLPCEDIGRLGTFRTYTSLIDTCNATFCNLTFENASGCGPQVGQALAAYIEGDSLFFENCRFLGGQDTVFTGPLPAHEIIPGGFTGPKQFAPRINGRQHYKNCYIEGDIDFVFGSASVYFEECEFHSKGTDPAVTGYVTAASTPKGQTYGYVMERCRFTGDAPDSSVYLGRPWREYAKVALFDCYLGSHIHPAGFHDWDKPRTHDTAFFAEYQSHGPGMARAKRPGWVKQFTKAEAKACLTLFKKFMMFMPE